MNVSAIASPLPITYTNVNGKPLLLVVHASKTYDYRASVRGPIMATLSSLQGSFNTIEIKDKFNSSYILFPKHLIAASESQGTILGKDFMHSYSRLLESTDTFVFVGGKAIQCLLNAFLSIFFAKLSELEQLYLNDTEVKSAQSILPTLLSLPKKDDNSPINFHFNCKAVYLSELNLKRMPKDTDLVHYTIERLCGKIRALLADSGLSIQDLVDGKQIEIPVSDGSRSKRPINIYFWSSTEKMAQYFRNNGTIANA